MRRQFETLGRFVITMAKLAPICWAGAKQAASEGRQKPLPGGFTLGGVVQPGIVSDEFKARMRGLGSRRG